MFQSPQTCTQRVPPPAELMQKQQPFNVRTVPASRVADYIVGLGAHDESGVIQLNNLIEHEHENVQY